MTLGRRISRF